MNAVIAIWVVVVVVWGLVKNKKISQFKKIVHSMQQPVNSNPREDYLIKFKTAPDHKDAESKKESLSNMMEDKQNDWLAKQIREEQKILKRGNMLDLGASHSKICSAKALKLEHILEHDACILEDIDEEIN